MSQIVLVVDEHDRLEGVLTDGDIRRALLAGATLDVAGRGRTSTGTASRSSTERAAPTCSS